MYCTLTMLWARGSVAHNLGMIRKQDGGSNQCISIYIAILSSVLISFCPLSLLFFLLILVHLHLFLFLSLQLLESLLWCCVNVQYHYSDC